MKLLLLSVLAIVTLMEVTALDRPFIVVGDTYPPYSFLENGEYKGTDVDIIKAVFKKININPTFKFRPWARAIAEVKSGKSDAIYSLFETSEREAFLSFPATPLNFEKNVIVVSSYTDRSAKTIEDIKGWRIGVVTENSYGKAFDEYKDIERIQSMSNELLVLQLNARNRLDAIIINELLFDTTVNNYVASGKIKTPNFRKLEYIPNNAPLYIGFSKNSGIEHELLAEKFSDAMLQLKKDGVVQEIISRYTHKASLHEILDSK